MNPLRSAILNVVHHSTRFPAIQHAAFGSLSARRFAPCQHARPFGPCLSACQLPLVQASPCRASGTTASGNRSFAHGEAVGQLPEMLTSEGVSLSVLKCLRSRSVLTSYSNPMLQARSRS
jgi:hypothetical protein